LAQKVSAVIFRWNLLSGTSSYEVALYEVAPARPVAGTSVGGVSVTAFLASGGRGPLNAACTGTRRALERGVH
jgi:hypothetical protein